MIQKLRASGSSSLVKAGSTGHPGTRVTAWNEAIDLAPGPQRHLLNTLGAVVVQGFVQLARRDDDRLQIVMNRLIKPLGDLPR
jgi:hypothetical protein